MYCRKCGEKLSEGAKFCRNCGTPVSKSAVAPTPKPVPEPASELALKPVPEPASEPALKSVPEPASEPALKPMPEPAPKPVTESVAKHATGAGYTIHEGSTKTSKLPFVLAGGIVLLVILVLAGGFFAIKAWSSHPEPEQEIPALESAAEFETESEQKPEKVKVVEKVPESETEEDMEVSEETQDEEAEENVDEEASEYFIPGSDSRYLTKDELKGYTADDCRIARNELFARHGRKFSDPDLQAYFDSKSWYKGTIEPEDFDDNVFNDYEFANRDLIVEYEEEMGYR